MSESTKTKDTKTSHFDKVRIDLDECRSSLSNWCFAPEGAEAEAWLHAGTEALMRAVSTLSLVVEQQP